MNTVVKILIVVSIVAGVGLGMSAILQEQPEPQFIEVCDKEGPVEYTFYTYLYAGNGVNVPIPHTGTKIGCVESHQEENPLWSPVS